MNSLLSRANRSFQAASKHQSQDQRSLQSYVMEILTENKSFTAVDQARWTEAETHTASSVSEWAKEKADWFPRSSNSRWGSSPICSLTTS